MNLTNLVCTAFPVNVVRFTMVKLVVEISQYVLKEHKTNCEKAEQDKSAVAKHT
jgi:phosphoenolpyruvate carboxylase